VDVAKLKAEYTAHRYSQTKPTLQAKVFGHVRTLNRLGAATPALANFINRLWPMRKLVAAMTGLASQRSIPEFSRSLYRWFEKRKTPAPSTAPTVVLFGDCFVTYNESHIGMAAVQLLETLGYQVQIPRTGCCARALISTGLLPQAIETADQTLNQLKPFIEDANVKAILVAEPSCLSAFKDDWLSLKLTTPLELRKQLAAKSFLVEEFVDCQWESHPKRPSVKKGNGPVLLHGHCHQKALWGDSTSGNLIRRLVGDRLTVIPSGCCGMAGSFGYTAKHYDVSMNIGELSVFPPIRANEAAIVLAPGTSCRHQIHDGTGRKALHPIELAARLLCD
jgi:Fe-S oxidoreductase